VPEKLLDDHARMREVCAELAALVAGATPCALNALADCRWKLARLILRHLPVEDRLLYQRLSLHPDPAAVITKSESCIRC
jgi:hypothetical protein